MNEDFKSLFAKLWAGNWVILNGRELSLLVFVIGGLLAIALYFLFRHFEPPPPKIVTISAGAKEGAYYKYAEKYAAAAKKHGITLKVLESNGSNENLARLLDEKSGVDFAFIQSGTTEVQEDGSLKYATLESLATIAYEPIWVISKASSKFARIVDLKGKRIAIGADGSGTQPVARTLLKANDIDATNATLQPLASVPAIDALQAGQLDAVIAIASPRATFVQDAFATGLSVMPFDQADAYTRRYDWAAKVTYPMGGASLAQNVPSADVPLIAANANLVARTSTHRAVAFLMLDIASEIHAPAGPLHDLKFFPNERNLVFAQSDESKRFFKTGRPFLQRFLPFWLANLVERLLVSVVPILAIGIPLLKLIPTYFDYREKSELLQLYEEAFQIEHAIDAKSKPRDEVKVAIDVIEEKLDKLRLGANRHVDFYNLKGHLDVVRARL
jgi:TRAP transporter TAXI family solute receptor